MGIKAKILKELQKKPRRLKELKAKLGNDKKVARAVDELADRLADLGYVRDRGNQGADFYYVLSVRVEDDAAEPLSLGRRAVDEQNGNDAFSPHSPKIVG